MAPPADFPIWTVTLGSIIPALVVLFLAVSAALNAPDPPPQGCRKLGIDNKDPAKSNLADEYDYNDDGTKEDSKKEDDSMKEETDSQRQIKIKALLTHPIKSCHGIELAVARFASTGITYDRQFCLAEWIAGNEQTKRPGRWDCRTLRDGKWSKLALIRPEIWVPDRSVPGYSSSSAEVRSGGVLVIHYPRTNVSGLDRLLMALGIMDRELAFRVPLNPPRTDDYPVQRIRIFKSSPTAISYAKSHPIPPTLASFLGLTPSRVALFRCPPPSSSSSSPSADGSTRRVNGNASPLETTLGFSPARAFADEYPLQMQNLASIRALASTPAVKAAIPRFSVRRFRPNIVLEGAGKFVEDKWTKVRIKPRRIKEGGGGAGESGGGNKGEGGGEGTVVYVCCRTVRCRLPNVDPDTGVRHPVEPDKTLRETRDIDPGAPGAGCMGMMMVPAVRDFVLRVGDTVEVLETGEHYFTRGVDDDLER